MGFYGNSFRILWEFLYDSMGIPLGYPIDPIRIPIGKVRKSYTKSYRISYRNSNS